MPDLRHLYTYLVRHLRQVLPVSGKGRVRAFAASAAALILVSVIAACTHNSQPQSPPQPQPQSAVASKSGTNFQICPTYNSDGTEHYTTAATQYLTSPYTYHQLTSGSKSYTVAEYRALLSGGASLPPLPAYIAGEDPKTEAAVIFAPGSTVNQMAPLNPLLYFFEGGQYKNLGFASVSGDEFIGGSAAGYPEPSFDDGGETSGGGTITQDSTNLDFSSGGSSTLTGAVQVGATSIALTSPLSQYIKYLNFSDGSTYAVDSASGATVTLAEPVTSAQAAGSSVWGNSTAPVAEVKAAAGAGATSVTLTKSAIPIVPWGDYVIGAADYRLPAVSGNQSGFTLEIGRGGLDAAVAANTPVYYNDPAGGVTVSYLTITHDIHYGQGAVITTGVGWTITHNNIRDGYSDGKNIPKPGGGFVASTVGTGDGNGIFGGDEATIEYNCLSRMGNNAMAGWFGVNQKFDYNEIYQSNYQNDPGCGCSAGAKWWGSLNTDIVGNAFVDDGIGGADAIWLDNGNTGTNISGNYFDKSYGSAIENETGFNIKIASNIFKDSGWGSGSGCGSSNCVGAVNLNSSGGANVPLSRYNNQTLVSGNKFINDWGGVDIWESGLRNCESSGEGYPIDTAYCSGGFPTTATAAANGVYYFSHQTDSKHGGTTTLARPVTANSTTVVLQGDTTTGQPAAAAVNDQIGFADPRQTKSTDVAKEVTRFNGSRTSARTGALVVAGTAGFPASGELRVGTTAAGNDGGGGFTGAILRYTGTGDTKTACGVGAAFCFTGVSFVRGAGTLEKGDSVLQVQPYKVMAETCSANDCALTVSPAVTAAEPSGATVTSAGTCPLFATGAATPSTPVAADDESYFDGCQWAPRNISVTGNEFSFAPAVIAAGVTVTGRVGTSCTASNANECGTNFMAYQATGQAPWGDSINENAMMSQSSLTGCASWDSGCTASPLVNLNASSSPPNAPANNGEKAWNDIWSNNKYSGPWQWDAYSYGTCSSTLPRDPATGDAMPSDACVLQFANWQGYWQQDLNSTYSGTVTSTPSKAPAS
jgi:hypothetical protein